MLYSQLGMKTFIVHRPEKNDERAASAYQRLIDPDGLIENSKYQTIPREIKLTDSKIRIYQQEDINIVQDMTLLRVDVYEYFAYLQLYVDVNTGGYIFFGTPRPLLSFGGDPRLFIN